MNDNTYRGHELTNVVEDWMTVNSNKIKNVMNNIIDHIDRRLQSLETAPQLAALRVITSPTEWPVGAAELATHSEDEVNNQYFIIL